MIIIDNEIIKGLSKDIKKQLNYHNLMDMDFLHQ
jgi:hypothetical protein